MFWELLGDKYEHFDLLNNVKITAYVATSYVVLQEDEAC